MKIEDTTNKDQVQAEPSEKDQAADTPSKEDQAEKEPSKIGSMDEAMNQWEEKQKGKKKASPAEPEAKKEEPCKTCSVTDEELKKDEKKDEVEANFFITDKEGKVRHPALFKSDGKDYNPDSVEKILNWGNFGIHRKSGDDEIEKAKPVVDFLLKASSEGNLLVRDEKGIIRTVDGKEVSSEGASGGEADIDEEDDTQDPKVQSLEKEVKVLKDKDKVRDETQMKKDVVGHYESLKSEVGKLREGYFAAIVELEEGMPKGVWGHLGEVVGPRGEEKPKYTPEEAMKVSHETTLKFVDKLLDAHPEIIEKKSAAIIAKYLEGKKERESTPVGTPSDTPAATTPSGEKKYTGITDAMKDAEKFFREKGDAGKKY